MPGNTTRNAASYLEWKRYWCEAGVGHHLTTDGYLIAPSEYINATVKPASIRTDDPCVIFLGSPGIGKSTDIEITFNRQRSEIADFGGIPIFVNLKTFDSSASIKHDLFKSEWYSSWKTSVIAAKSRSNPIVGQGTPRPLFLTLDNFDECLVSVKPLFQLILNEIRETGPTYLMLRIACRSGFWSKNFEDDLRGVFPRVSKFEMLPLTRDDVVLAANDAGVDAEIFCQQLEDKKLVSLATRPITLKSLIEEYKRSSSLPGTAAEAYHRHLVKLVTEHDYQRPPAPLDTDISLRIAGRVALMTVFGSKTGITVEAKATPTTIDMTDIIGNRKYPETPLQSLSAADVKNVLSSALFTTTGDNVYLWAHATYAEYLASWYLKENNVSDVKVESLIVTQVAGEFSFVPQLQDAVYWICHFYPTISSRLVDRNPLAALKIDAAAISSPDKERIIDYAIEQANNEKIAPSDIYRFLDLERLNYQGLDAKLTVALSTARSLAGKLLALEIARRNRVTSLTSVIADLAINQSENMEVRKVATSVVADIGDNASKVKLKVLLTDAVDESDDLKGYALQALWPGLISADELFASIATPKRQNYGGGYSLFLHSRAFSHLDKAGVISGLNWLRERPGIQNEAYGLRDLHSDLVVRAFGVLDDSILEPLAEILTINLREYEGYSAEDKAKILEAVKGKDDLRRKLIAKIALLLGKEAHLLVFSPYPQFLLTSSDSDWFIAYVDGMPEGETKTAMTRVLLRTSDIAVETSFEGIYRLYECSQSCRAAITPYLGPVDLQSQQAVAEKNRYYQALSYRKKTLSPTPQERVEQAIIASENGDGAKWRDLVYHLGLEGDAERYNDSMNFRLNIGAFPGWVRADEAQRKRIVESAIRYLKVVNLPGDDSWIGAQSFNMGAMEPYLMVLRSLVLVLTTGSVERLREFDKDDWAKWTPAVLGQRHDSDSSINAALDILMVKAKTESPTTFRDYVLLLIERECTWLEHISSVGRVASLLDDLLVSAIVTKIDELKITPTQRGSIFEAFVGSRLDAARKYVRNMFAESLSGEIRMLAAINLLDSDDAESWRLVWEHIRRPENLEEGMCIFLAFAKRQHLQRRIFSALTEAEAGELFLWLLAAFPIEEDPRPVGVFNPSDRYLIGIFRNDILRWLVGMGTMESVRALEAIMRSAPQHREWLVGSITETKINLERSTWVPLAPDEILEFVKKTATRVINDDYQLLEVVAEALERIQGTLHGETGFVRFLWNQIGKAKWRPKIENDLSDFLKRELDQELTLRGIIVNREVEIKRKTAEGTEGERTDIHINAATRSEGETFTKLTCIVEVKGCWHPEIEHAMESQLADKYLTTTNSRAGIYLIGWFLCDGWDQTDSKWKKTTKLEFDGVVKKYREQAEGCSKAKSIYVRSFIMDCRLT